MFCLFFLPHLFPFTLNRIIDNSKKIADLIDDKSYDALSIPLRPPPDDQIIPISHVHDMALMVWMLRHVLSYLFFLLFTFTYIRHVSLYLQRSAFWVKGKLKVTDFKQPFWYVSCERCHRATGSVLQTLFECLFCDTPQARAIPWFDQLTFVFPVYK